MNVNWSLALSAAAVVVTTAGLFVREARRSAQEARATPAAGASSIRDANRPASPG